jgi:hypothetical protein
MGEKRPIHKDAHQILIKKHITELDGKMYSGTVFVVDFRGSEVAEFFGKAPDTPTILLWKAKTCFISLCLSIYFPLFQLKAVAKNEI